MTLKTKQYIIGFLGLLFVLSLVFVQWLEIVRKQEEVGGVQHVSVPVSLASNAISSSRRGLSITGKGARTPPKGSAALNVTRRMKGRRTRSCTKVG